MLLKCTQTDEYTTDQCSQAETQQLELTTAIIMENQPLDQYWTTPYGDFAIRKTRFGVYTSYDRELVQLVTGGTYEAVFKMTPSHLQWAREGYIVPEGQEVGSYSSSVGVKL